VMCPHSESAMQEALLLGSLLRNTSLTRETADLSSAIPGFSLTAH
jgi:hypothetical protein